jgi:hypothetical protein
MYRYGLGTWTEAMRKRYNFVDAVTRHTVQVTMIMNDSSSVEIILAYCS